MEKGHIFEFDMTEAFPHLASAPIVEAVIHLRARAAKWPNAQELGQHLSEQLPDYPDCRPQQQLELEAQVAADGPSTQTRRDRWHGFRLISADKLNIAQFTRDGLLFSRLMPYETWDPFSGECWRLWRIFMELTGPSEVQRLGVRFINRIALHQLAEVREYLNNPPECLESVGLPTTGFLYQSRHDVLNTRST